MERKYTSVRLEITSHCNLNCKYCHNAKYSNRADDMSTDDILKLINNLKNHYDINKVLLTGGEPMINKDLCRIIRELTSLGIKADMVTNATLLTEEMAIKLQGAGLKRIRISIDELDEESKVRGTTNPNNLWETARMIVEKTNIQLCIHTVCTPTNVKSLFSVYKKVLEIGAARWRVFDIGFQGNLVEESFNFQLDTYYNDLIVSTKRILEDYLGNSRKDVLEMEINNIFRTAFLDMEETEFNIDEKWMARLNLSPCDYITKHQLSVRSNGEATLCQYFHNPIFDFAKSNYDVDEAVKKRIAFLEDEITMKDVKYCSKCKYCLVCNSGCRSRAKFLTGDICDADPGACYLHPMVHHEIMSMLPNKVQRIYESLLLPNGLEPKYCFEDLKDFLKEKGYNV